MFVNILTSLGPEKAFKCVIYFSNHDNCYKIKFRKKKKESVEIPINRA